MGCNRNETLSCAAMVLLFGEKRVIVPKPAEKMALSKSCNGGNTRDCTIGGVLEAASGGVMGKNMLERACRAGDKFACEAVKSAK